MLDEMDKHIIDLNNISCRIEDDNRAIKLISLNEFKSKYRRRECSLQPLMPLGTEVNVKVGSRTSMYCFPRLLNDVLAWEDKGRSQKIVSQVSFNLEFLL